MIVCDAMNGKKKQVCFRIDETTVEEMQRAAAEEGLRGLGPFCRELMKWAFAHYKQATSLFILKQAKVTTPQVGTKKIRSHVQ